MKHCKSLIAILLAVLMIVPMFAFTANAGEKEDIFNANWRLSAMKWQSQGEYKHIGDFIKTYYADNNYQPIYEITDEGGIKCTALPYAVNGKPVAPGAMSAQCLTTLNKCSLDDLEIKLTFDDFTMNHLVNLSSSIHMLWCTKEIGGIVDGYYSDYAAYCEGMEQAFPIGQNGLRDTIPADSKALAINLCNSSDTKQNDLKAIFSCIQITYYDGDAKNWFGSEGELSKIDGHVGKRWTFMQRSGDVINQPAERVDFSEGLTIKISKDDELGYKVSLIEGNGMEHKYYDKDKVAYFPPTKDRPQSNYEKQDLDFSGLKGLQGYLSVGVNGSNKDDTPIWTLDSVNGIPAYQFTGHTHTPAGEVITEQDFPCHEGISYQICSECGEKCNIQKIAAAAHTWGEWTEEPAEFPCQEGKKTHTCTVCGDSEDEVIPATAEHQWSDWKVKKEATFEADGEEARECAVCKAVETKVIPKLSNPFIDVKADDWFFNPVMWAVTNGITSGLDATHFGPGNTCTRAQVVTFLYAAAGKPEIETTDNPFVDVKADDWFYKAVLWAVENKVTSGMDATHFAPAQGCTRAQVVTFLNAAKGKPAATSAKNPFVDVKEGDWFYNPVLWAVENKITSGLDATHFGPNSVCTRAQIVTFLYAAK